MLLWVFSTISAAAQPTSPPAQDPLMSLMLSQPRIDVESPVQPTAAFDPPVVRPGERVTYRVVLNALEASIEWPEALPKLGTIQMARGAHGQLMAMSGSLLAPSTTFNYHARLSVPGRFTIPSFTVQVYGKPVTIPEAQLEVRTDLPASLPPAPQLIFEIPTNNIFVGQAVRARVFSPPQPGGGMQGLAQVQVTGEGFIVDTATVRPRVDSFPGRAGMTVVHEVMLTPIASGKLSGFAQGYAIANRASGGLVIGGPGIFPGGAGQYTLLDSDRVEFSVKPLPKDGELPGFTGGVGQFRVEPPQLSTNWVRAGDPVKLTVRVRGDGNLLRLVAPAPPRLRDWQIFQGSADATHPQIIQAQGFITFSYSLVPLTDKSQASPAIPFSCFDPTQGAYVDCTIPSVPLSVAPGALPVDLGVIERAQTAGESQEKVPILSGLAERPGLAASSLVPLQQQAWFPLVQIAPALGLLGLWGWDRRRRFYEAHPDARLRRHARRAVRRERKALARAARARDIPEFTASAVAAMQEACSPYYPAEPRALVGADVLAVLPEGFRTAAEREVVRRFFEETDAARFGNLQTDGLALLEHRAELERLLDALEARL